MDYTPNIPSIDLYEQNRAQSDLPLIKPTHVGGKNIVKNEPLKITCTLKRDR